MLKSNFNNRSLRESLKITFSCIILSFTLIFLLLLLLIHSIMNNFRVLKNTNLPLMESSQSAICNHLSTQNVMHKLCLTEDLTSQKEYEIQQNAYDMNLQQELKYLLKHAPTYKSNITKIQQSLQEALSYRNQAILYCKQNLSGKALDLLEAEYFPRMISIQCELTTLYNIFSNQNASFLSRYNNQMLITLSLVILCLILMLAISFSLIKKLIRQIQSPLVQIGTAMSKMAQGELHFELPYTATNEFGDLANEMRYMGKELLNYISNISDILSRLAHKNYDTQVDIEYKGMFLPIQEALNTIIEELNEMIHSFHQTALQITRSANQMITTANVLSESSLQQSSTVQELSATMENLSYRVEQNAENVQTASSNTLQLGEKLLQGNHSTHELLELMNTTASSAQEIQKIIGLIEGISKQTHLLALNSTIEAARVGSSGNAFSILAMEMGNLALETSKAVQLTKHLITNTLEHISKSHDAVYHTASMIEDATLLSKTISNHIQSVAKATRNQSDAIQNFHSSIHAITTIIDENTQVAIALASKGHELNESAYVLNDKISAFTLEKSL
ncbi:MAG: methyl-accepting chemotaxis protein [Cellulosilyticum sp.]|nr:methyl-accepting chemotaxis protein [Cellulosilyticum sp.]